MRGRPVLGAIAGFFFGAFLALDLVFLGVIASDSPLLASLPFFTLAGGIGLAAWAPLGTKRPPQNTA